MHNGWFGGYNRNSQQSQQQQQQADHLISPYVTGLPAEILEQVWIQHERLLFFVFFQIAVFDLLPSFHFVQSQVVVGAHNGQSIHAPRHGLVGYELQ